MFKTVAIVGLGLIGGSIARMLKRKAHDVTVIAYGRKPELLRDAVNEGFIDDAGSIDAIQCRDVDLFIIATPVISSIETIISLLNDPHLKHDALIIDAGSVKQAIVDAVVGHQKAHQFVGCHPMAGSEKTGYANSSHAILSNAWVIITPHGTNRAHDIEKIDAFWRMLECRTHITDAATHDQRVGYSSHLPHVVSSLLMKTFYQYSSIDYESMRPFIGKGFKDTSRLAGGSPDMWADIVLLNSGNIIHALEDYLNVLHGTKDVIVQASKNNDREPLRRYFEDVQQKWKKHNA